MIVEGGFGTEQMRHVHAFAPGRAVLEALSARHRGLLQRLGGTTELSFEMSMPCPASKAFRLP